MARPARPSDPGLLILMSLAQGDNHGYGIMKDVQDFAGLKLGAGTLYGAIARLEHDGLIEALAADEPRRRPYRLTRTGREALRAQLESLERWARVGRTRLAPEGAS
jgi:DNA-binding PadR family transcriptional regulator